MIKEVKTTDKTAVIGEDDIPEMPPALSTSTSSAPVSKLEGDLMYIRTETTRSYIKMAEFRSARDITEEETSEVNELMNRALIMLGTLDRMITKRAARRERS